MNVRLIDLGNVDSLAEAKIAVLKAIEKELGSCLPKEKPTITTCYCDHCGAPLEDDELGRPESEMSQDDIKYKLADIGKKYLQEGAPPVIASLGDLFRIYLTSNKRYNSFKNTESSLPVGERMMNIYDSDLENFLEEFKFLINDGTYTIE